MKILFFLLTLSVLSFAADDNNNKLNSILNKYAEACQKVYQLEYDIQRIDTFPNGTPRFVKGYAFIKRVKEDTVYGYHFAGEIFDQPGFQKNIYDGINSFSIDNSNKTYKLEKSIKGFPGHQLVVRIADLLFFPDDKHSNVIISNETNETYTIEYQYKDEPTVTNLRKAVVLDKNTYLPVQLKLSGISLSKRYSHQFILNNLRINEEVLNTIDRMKLDLSAFSEIKEKAEERNFSLINKQAPDFLLTKLSDQNSLDVLYNKKITLVDFWEVWCGHCIEAMPKVEALYKKLSGQIDITGIVTQDSVNAKMLVKKLGITFNSFIGNDIVLKEYGVDSFPRYFLVDKEGIIRKEYSGFSDEIEKDINILLEDK